MDFEKYKTTKNAIIIVIIIILIVSYFMFFRKTSGKTKRRGKHSKKRKKSKVVKHTRTRKKNHKPSQVAKSKLRSMIPSFTTEQSYSDSFDESEDDSEQEDATDIYNMVHHEMLEDIQVDEFKQLTGLDDMMFVEIKELYTTAIDEGRDPQSITAYDYDEILYMD